jgi:hypothetical protein
VLTQPLQMRSTREHFVAWAKVFAAKTQAPRKILFNSLEKRTERPASGNDKGLSPFI